MSRWTATEETVRLRWVADLSLGNFGNKKLQQANRLVHYVDGVIDTVEIVWYDVPYEPNP